MSKKCSVKDCQINHEFLLNQFDDGKERVALCPNHIIMFVLDMIKEDIEKYPTELEKDTDLACDICGKEGYVFFDGKETVNVCKEHLSKLVRHDLKPDEFFVLYKEHPDMYLLHDDFYDPETGESFQPVPLDSEEE